MLDDNWELVAGPSAHDIEVANLGSQVNLIEAFVHFVQATSCDPLAAIPPQSLLCELHRRGTLFLLQSPGAYRLSQVHLSNGTDIIYLPPPAAEVPALVDEFCNELVKRWSNSTPAEVAAFCLWKINWIHPFKNGNGRTARAFAYACLCLKYGFWLPGSPTVIDRITGNKPPFEAALRLADVSHSELGLPDLSLLTAYVNQLLADQLAMLAGD